MELLIINNEDSDFYEEDELAMVKTAVIFSEKITVVNYSFKDLVFYCNLDKLTDKQLMDYYLKTLMESDMPNKEYHIIDGKRMFKDMMELKKRKFKDHNSIIYLGQLEKNFAGIKKHTEEEDKTWLEEENMYPLVNFYNDKTLNVIIHDPTEDKENESIPDRLIEAFTGSDAMQFFNGIILSDKDFPYDSPSEFLSEVLFEIPNLDSLSYPQLKIIRNELTETFKPFYDAVSGMQKEFSATLYKEENLEYIEQRTSEILDPYFALLKDTVENNIMEYNVVNGIKSGKFRLYTDRDHLAISGELKNNRNNGIWTYYYPSGKIESTGTFKDDIIIGKWIFYYEDGTIKEEGFYTKGERDGKWVTYNENGIIQSQVTFEKGKAICEIKTERFVTT